MVCREVGRRPDTTKTIRSLRQSRRYLAIRRIRKERQKWDKSVHCRCWYLRRPDSLKVLVLWLSSSGSTAEGWKRETAPTDSAEFRVKHNLLIWIPWRFLWLFWAWRSKGRRVEWLREIELMRRPMIRLRSSWLTYFVRIYHTTSRWSTAWPPHRSTGHWVTCPASSCPKLTSPCNRIGYFGDQRVKYLYHSLSACTSHWFQRRCLRYNSSWTSAGH